ncbi:hypothetical protein RJ639_024551 [Escallonia herrerae]|uniref:Uncharacterized protein n=1 Tax=Escallonia herrerae TaxID=1293975 RepID=A0AA88UZI1_9ASTE|nr:hypothetical protein RJ639_024551 [Escallonia herrerae]
MVGVFGIPVRALQQIAKTLGKTDWNFSVDPCSGQSKWATLNPAKGSENAVTCDCTFNNNTVCHVVSIDLTFNKLSGQIPGNFAGLSNTDYIYLTGNLLAGPMPDWMMKEGDSIGTEWNESRAKTCLGQKEPMLGSRYP